MKTLAATLAYLLLGLILVLGAAAAWLSWGFDPDAYRADLDRILSQATAMEVSTGGRIRHRLLDGPQLAVTDVVLRKDGKTVARVEELRADLAPRRLLDRALVVSKLQFDLSELDLGAWRHSIETADASTRSDAPPPVTGLLALLHDGRIERLEIRIGQLSDAPIASEPAYTVQGFVLATGPVLLLEQRRPVAFDLASVLARGLSGDVRFASLSTDGGRFEDLALNFSAKPGRIDAELQNLRLQLPTAATEGLNLRGRLSLRPLPKSGPAILESLDLDAGPLALAADHGSPIRLGQVHLRGEQLSLPQAGARPGWKMLAQVLAGAPAALQIEARDLDYRGRHLDAMRLELSGAEPGFNVRLPETRFGETRAQGDGWADPTQPELPWRLRFKAEQVELAFVHELIQASGAARGRLRVDADLTGTGMHADLWPTRLNGRLLIQGNDIEIAGLPLDQLVDRGARARSINLIDIGAYALAGPGATLLTKSRDYQAVERSLNGQDLNRLKTVHIDVDLKDGVVQARDVAAATNLHRFAVKGSLDLHRDGPLNLTIATVDALGCARFMETLNGTLNEPKVSKSGLVVKGVVQPVTGVVGGVIGALTERCAETFYDGVVAHPPQNEPPEPD